jgi:hypothetical protein
VPTPRSAASAVTSLDGRIFLLGGGMDTMRCRWWISTTRRPIYGPKDRPCLFRVGTLLPVAPVTGHTRVRWMERRTSLDFFGGI